LDFLMAQIEQIKFIVPVGFRGAFAVVEDRDAPPVRQEDDLSVYEIPQSGLLSTSSVMPLREWHTASAAFSDASPLLVKGGSPVTPYSDGEIKLRYLYTDSDGRTYFLVGTESEQAEALKHGSALHLGGVRKETP
jgi:hypothetical protein